MKIYEIFQSIDGEVNYFHQGCITTFIRVAGCNFWKNPCLYCDTKYAADPNSGKEMEVKEIIDIVSKLGGHKITITGGEPLFQMKEFYELTKKLYHSGFNTSVETNGSLPLEGYGVGSWVTDFKLPGSGNYDKMDHKLFVGLNSSDFVKFVITDKNDYRTAIREKNYLQSDGCHAKFAFSPVFGPCRTLENRMPIVDWLIQDKVFDAIINVQIHKILDVL